MATLVARAGDAQALKACVAAKLSGADLQFTAVGSLAEVRSKGANPFGTNSLLLTTTSGTQLTCPNTAAQSLGGAKLVPAPQAAQVSQWVEWEASVLRPAALLGGDKLAAAAAQLAQALRGGLHLAGATAATLADVVVYCTLLPVQQAGALPSDLSPYMAAMEQQEAVKQATAQVLGGKPPSELVSVLQADSAAFQAAIPKLPVKGQRNILITSALPYVNNVPHLGNIIGCVLSADCYARYCRARGINCIFVCGTDEYGTATETKALEEGLTCQEICDKYHAIHAGIYQWFDIAFDRFGRTPTRMQTRIAQDIFRTLDSRSNLVEQSMEQLYSEALGKFLADRFVTGTCPKCGYEDARGDQCDACGNLLNPTELLQPKCKITGTTPVVRSTRHVFLDLPKLSPELQDYITRTSTLGGWSSNCVQVTNAWMRDGLKYRCITRDLKWGTPVPKAGFEEKVFYVWFDAPIGYISITANYTPDWEAWWKNPEDVELVQFMGKDNVPFHTVIFPATQLGTGEAWTMMKNISVTEYLNYEGGKFSKSRGTGVFGNDAQSTGIPCEVWRYYLLSNRPEQSDTDFKWADLQAKTNSELMANLGNFINRGLMFVAKFFEGKVPAATAKGAELVGELGKAVGPKVEEYMQAMERIKLKEGIRLAMAVSADGNKFLQDTKPWVAVKDDPELCATIVAAGVGLVRLLAALVQPFMPALTRKVLAQLDLPEEACSLTDDLVKGSFAPHTLVAPGHAIGTPGPLISQISDETIEQLRARFGGTQAERDAKAAAAPAKPAGKGAAPADKAKGGDKKADGAKGGDKKPAADGAAAKGGEKKGDKGGEKKPADGKGGEKAEKGGKKGGAAAAEEKVDISRLDIRVGLIRKAWRHPDAESLYIEEIDVGEEQPRQVVSGLVKYIPEPDMQQRRVLVLCNLKPATMRGVASHAMVLAATSPDGATVELVEPPEGAAPGERVQVAGFEGPADEQLNPKKRVFESVQPDLSTNEQRVACYKGLPLTTSKGPCTVASVVGASIK